MLLWMTLAFAGPTDSNLDETLDALGRLQPAVHLVQRIKEPFEVTDGPLTLRIEEGWIVPVFAGEAVGEFADRRDLNLERLALLANGMQDDLIGFAWVGEGTATLYFSRPGEALRFANHQVIAHGDAEELGAVARREEPFVTTIDRGYVLGDTPWLFDRVWPNGPPTVNEVLVYDQGNGARVAADRAATAMMSRVRVHDDHLGDMQRELAWQRLASRHGQTEPVLFTEVHTASRFGVVDLPGDPSTPADGWLSSMPSTPGSTYQQVIQTIGPRHDQTGLAGMTWTGGLRPTTDPDDPTAPPARLARPTLGDAEIDLYVQRELGSGELFVEGRTRMTITAKDGGLAWLDLDLGPLTDDTPIEITRIARADGAELLTSRRDVNQDLAPQQRVLQPQMPPALDNIPVPDQRQIQETRPEEDGRLLTRRSLHRILLPEPLAEGESVTVDLWWKDSWSHRNGELCMFVGDAGAPAMASGISTGLRRLFPQVPSAGPGEAWTGSLRLHLPADSKLEYVVSGEQTTAMEDGEWKVEGYELGRRIDPTISFGKYSHLEQKGRLGFPGMEVHLRTTNDRGLRTFPVEIRQVLQYYGRVMPDFPFDYLQVVEGPPTCWIDNMDWSTTHGAISINQILMPDSMNSPRFREPALESHRLAAALARSWWFYDGAVASDEDAWLNHSLSWGMACMYVGAAHGSKACDIRFKTTRLATRSRDVRRGTVALTLPANGQRFRRQSLGPMVLFHMLRNRIGNRAFFLGLHRVLSEHPGEGITTDRVRQYLSDVSGQDLSDFFDFWVEGGVAPKVRVEWTEGAHAAVSGKVYSDVPFGHFDIEVVIQRDGEADDAIWVDVYDGEGEFSIGPGARILGVQVDPGHLTLTRASSVRRVD